MPALLDAISHPGLIVCEGPDDERFLRMMLVHLGIDSVWVEYVEGESQFRRYVRGLRGRAGFEVLRAFAIVRDADRATGTKFEHACALLRDFGYPSPHQPVQLARGQFPARAPGTSGRIGATAVVVLPIDRRTGALEDLCLESLAEDPSVVCVDDFLSCVATTGVLWPDRFRAKARLNAWLASRPDPRHRLRDALSAGLFPLDHNAFEPVKQFLHDLAAAARAPEAPSS